MNLHGCLLLIWKLVCAYYARRTGRAAKLKLVRGGFSWIETVEMGSEFMFEKSVHIILSLLDF